MPAEFDPKQFTNSFDAPTADLEPGDDLMWDLLSLYVDGEASPEEAAQVEQMLRHDAEYACAYSFMQQAGSTVRAIVEVEPPAFLRDSILAKTSHRPTFASRLSAALANLRTQLALPAVGRLTLAGGGLAAAALVLGVLSTRVVTPPPAINSDAVAVTSHPAHATPPQHENAAPVLPPDIVVPNPMADAVSNLASTDVPRAETSVIKPVSGFDTKSLKPALPPKTIVLPGSSTLVKATVGSKLEPGTLPQKPDAFTPKKSIVTQAPTPAFGIRNAGYDNPQNINPMMDRNAQHTKLAMNTPAPTGSGGDESVTIDETVVTNTGSDTKTLSPVPPTPDTDTTPKRKLVGALQLSKLPPSARHIQTAADIKQQLDARAQEFTAAAMEGGTQNRSSDVPVIAVKFN